MSEIEKAFKRKALEEFMRMAIRDQKASMKRQKIGETGEGEKSMFYTADDNSAKLVFRGYLRFVDMGVGRGQPIGKLTTSRVELLSQKKSGLALVKKKSFKARKQYSKPTYSHITWLQNKLLYGYGQQAIDAIKSELENQNPSSQ